MAIPASFQDFAVQLHRVVGCRDSLARRTFARRQTGENGSWMRETTAVLQLIITEVFTLARDENSDIASLYIVKKRPLKIFSETKSFPSRSAEKSLKVGAPAFRPVNARQFGNCAGDSV
ncbi:MAG: hypothetical protein ACR2IF_19055 [Terriglobales bacterium]